MGNVMYTPLYIAQYETGLVESRQNFLLPNDAYPTLENAFIWREQRKRKPGYTLLGRLRRVISSTALGVALDGAGAISNNIKTLLSPAVIKAAETNASLEPGSVVITDGINTYTDNGLGVLTGAPGGTGTINYTNWAFTITGGAPAGPLSAAFNYFPNLPCMGIRERERTNINSEQMVAFDQIYAYVYNAGFEEFIPGTNWTGTNSDFFWSTNYWVSNTNNKIFWVTNFSGQLGDPIRYTDGTAWVNFAPQINAAADKLNQCLIILPFRGRLIVLNTWEGANLATSVQYRQRIRWAAIGNPFDTVSGIVTSVNADAWRDDIQGQGGFLDIPTAEDIVSAGFVRDNLVIFCERSTWQLRYTGKSIAPFQIEKVNTELGAESTFSAVQFDTSLVGIGDKGVVECDSYKSVRIDEKIPDITFRFNNQNNGLKRVHGLRDLQMRLAYWCFPEANIDGSTATIFPNRRLVYNYENKSWAIFKDSFTCFGTYQEQSDKRWQNFPGPSQENTWQAQAYPWIGKPALFPSIVGGNHQGYVEYLGQANFELSTINSVSLYIKSITGNTTTATLVESPNHNLETGTIIEIQNIPTGTNFSSLNGQIFSIIKQTLNTFTLYKFDASTGQFSLPQLNNPATYIGGGEIKIRDNFKMVSKKFNYLEEGQSIQLGYVDILMNETTSGAITMNVYKDYNDNTPVNTYPQNEYAPFYPDPFFNTVIPTTAYEYEGSSKNFHRIYCNVRGSFVTIEYTLSNAQMAGGEQEEEVQIDAEIIYMRKAGKQLLSRF